MLGYGGHFLTKGRRYSVTFHLLRDTQIAYRRHEHQAHAHSTAGGPPADQAAEDTTLIVGTLTFARVGWHTSGDALLANRHTVVSLLMELGVPPHVVQAIARHADVKVTLKVYAHANLDAMRQALGKLDGRLS